MERDGRFWLVRVDGVGATHARHLRELDAMAGDLIAVMTGDEPDSIDIEYDIVLPTSVQAHLVRAAELRDQSARANSAAAAEVRAAARELSDSGLPLRDIGRLLGVSHQRAQQLLAG
ncbi:MAG TPA: hypothetical protein VKB57_06550 [Acidimicrobiales bacterium]|nr:hypothetical protein [Acidimicrobiales bacterium]